MHNENKYNHWQIWTIVLHETKSYGTIITKYSLTVWSNEVKDNISWHIFDSVDLTQK